jgi:hypothetical protein
MSKICPSMMANTHGSMPDAAMHDAVREPDTGALRPVEAQPLAVLPRRGIFHVKRAPKAGAVHPEE